jgi:PAS domain S-box-containing protein
VNQFLSILVIAAMIALFNLNYIIADVTDLSPVLPTSCDYSSAGLLLLLLLGFVLWQYLQNQNLKQREDRIRSEHELNLKYADIFAQTTDAIISADPDGKITAFNPAAERLFKFSTEKTIGTSITTLCAPHLQKQQSEILALLEDKKALEAVETERLTTEGVAIPVEMTLHLRTDENGRPLGTSAIMRDISDRIQNRREIRKFKTIFDNSIYGSAIVSLEGQIEYINNYFANIHGYSQEELIGQNLSIFHSEDQMKQVLEINKNIIKTGHYEPIEVYHINRDGKEFPMLMTAIILTDENDKPESIVASAVDISAQKAVEAQKSALEKHALEGLRLESLGRLAGGVAHDLNNLLYPIIAFGEILQEDLQTDQEAQKSVNGILGAAFRARNLVSQLLAFGGKQALDYHSVDLNEVIRDFEKLLRKTIREDIEIEIRQDPSIKPILADKGQIEQIILNLSINAADAMSDKGKLTISTKSVTLDYFNENQHACPAPETYSMLIISDTGSGMDDKTMKHLFEPFFSTKGSLGTGLGLATVHGIVKQHKGNIEVESRINIGTTFSICFPVTEQAVIKETPCQTKSAGKGGTETILLVEDDIRVRNATFKVLSRHGYTVLTPESSLEALELFNSHDHSIDLLLTDVMMPDMNGQLLYQKLLEIKPELKAVFMSGYTDNILKEKVLIEKHTRFIHKPFSIRMLTDKIRETLDEYSEDVR